MHPHARGCVAVTLLMRDGMRLLLGAQDARQHTRSSSTRTAAAQSYRGGVKGAIVSAQAPLRQIFRILRCRRHFGVTLMCMRARLRAGAARARLRATELWRSHIERHTPHTHIHTHTHTRTQTYGRLLLAYLRTNRYHTLKTYQRACLRPSHLPKVQALFAQHVVEGDNVLGDAPGTGIN